MMGLISQAKVYLALGSTDMRKQIDGLAAVVEDVLEQDPLSSHVFVFCNRGRDKLKILYWQNNGFWLCYRRLEKHKFSWPTCSSEQASMKVSPRELGWLLDGLSVTQKKAHKPLNYRHI